MPQPGYPRRAAIRLAALAAVIAALAVAVVLSADGASADALAGRATAVAHAPDHPVSSAPASPRSPSPSPSASAPAPSPGPQPSPATSSGEQGCSFLDINCYMTSAITGWFKNLVTSAINPVFGLLGKSLLATPQLDQNSEVQSLWTGSLVTANACFVLLVVAAGLILMGYQTVQTAYTVKDIAPRMVAGVVLANVSLLLAGKAIGFANALSSALLSPGVDPGKAASTLSQVITHAVAPNNAGMFVILVAIGAVVLGLILALIYVVRIMLTILLIGAAPLALACHALPQTEGLAKLWWRAFTGVLAIQVAQALVFIAAMRVFFSPGTATAFGLGGPDSSLTLWITICLLYVLVRVPFWISRMIWRGGVSHSPVIRVVRFVFAAAVLSRAGSALRGLSARRAAPRGGGGRPRGTRPGPAGPRRPPPGPGGGRGGTGGGAPGTACAGGPGPRRQPPRTGPRTGGGGPRTGSGGPQPAGPGQARRTPGSTRPPASGARPGAGAAGQPRQPSGPGATPAPGARRSTPSAGTAAPGRIPQPPGGPRPPGSGRAPGAAATSRARRNTQPPLPGMPPRPRAARPRQLTLPLDPPPARQPRPDKSPRGPRPATPRRGDR